MSVSIPVSAELVFATDGAVSLFVEGRCINWDDIPVGVKEQLDNKLHALVSAIATGSSTLATALMGEHRLDRLVDQLMLSPGSRKMLLRAVRSHTDTDETEAFREAFSKIKDLLDETATKYSTDAVT